MTVQHIPVGIPATATITVFDADGVAADLDAAPTYVVTDTSDDSEVDSGTATKPAGTGIYTVALDAVTAVTKYRIDWTGDLNTSAWTGTTFVEFVGEHLFTVDELRSFRGDDLSNTTNFPTADIVAVRAAITDEFEAIAGVSFVPRYHRETVAGSGGVAQPVEKHRVAAVLQCVISGVTVAASNFESHPILPVVFRTNGRFASSTTLNPRNVDIGYRHGYETVPADIRRAAIILARQRLIADLQGHGVPDHASSWTDPSGTFQAFAASSKSGRWYGLPAVDIPLARHRDANNIPIGG